MVSRGPPPKAPRVEAVATERRRQRRCGGEHAHEGNGSQNPWLDCHRHTLHFGDGLAPLRLSQLL